MLSEFYIAVEDFEANLRKCNQGLAEWSGVDHIHRHRMYDLGQDMFSLSESMIRAHISASMWSQDAAFEVNRHLGQANAESIPNILWAKGMEFLEGMIRRQKSRAADRSEESAWELRATYKSYFYFIRAFQDASYAVLLNLDPGTTAGRFSSMGDCVKKRKPPSVYAEIESIPGYIDWFRVLREKRNMIKEGVNASLCGPQWDVGIGFNKITKEGGLVVSGDCAVRLGDLTTAFRFSDALTRLVLQRIPASISDHSTNP